jgi:hypothetical protein
LTTIPTPEEMNHHLLELMRGLNAQIFLLLGDKVVSGPFRGMQIPEETPWNDGNASTKLLGSYEYELHETIACALERKPTRIINVGCAEGYYAIALARIASDAVVYAVDVDVDSLEVCRDYAARNNVSDRVIVVRGCQTARALGELGESIAGGHSLYLVDCEAAELVLLDKTECPHLNTSDLIIECHDFLDPTISAKLSDRFADTHRVEVIKPQLPRFEMYPFLAASPTVMAMMTVTEKRPMPTLWLACWAHTKGT